MSEILVDICDEQITILDNRNREIVTWVAEEWECDPTVVVVAIAYAIHIGHTQGPEALRKLYAPKKNHFENMKKLFESIGRLRLSADRSASNRGHELEWVRFIETPDRIAEFGTCIRCDLSATIDTKPPPNGIDIGGEAVALNCGDMSWYNPSDRE
jgi:hypothetical protein